MHLEIIELVCKKEGVNEIDVFIAAHDYEEIRIKKTEMVKNYLCCCALVDWKELKLVSLPEFVEDFCIDVLAKKVEMPKDKHILHLNVIF